MTSLIAFATSAWAGRMAPDFRSGTHAGLLPGACNSSSVSLFKRMSWLVEPALCIDSF